MDREQEMEGEGSSSSETEAENNLSEEEEDEEEERRESGIRCYQSDGENPGEEALELGAALTTSPGLSSASASPLWSPHHLFNSPDFEVELRAEVTLGSEVILRSEVILEGSVIGLLSSAVPRLDNRKTGFSPHPLPPAWTSPSPLSSSLQGVLDCRWPLGHLTPWPMDLTQAPGFKGRPPAPSSHGITETAKSSLPYSPSTSPSSPSSSPSSPSSSSSSPSATVTGYHNDVKGHAEGAGVSRVTGDMVSSTSASLAPPSLSTPPPDAASSSDPSFRLSSPRQVVGGQSEGGEKEMYDPFHPTEGEREGGTAEEEEEEEGEKYDPFDPTGSPASDAEEGRGIEEEGDGHSGAGGARTTDEAERDAENRDDDEEKEEAPPDSTDALPPPPASPRATLPPVRRRLDRNPNRTRGRGKKREKRENADTDHSEIEEGEIVGATERDGGGIGGGKRIGGGLLPLPVPSTANFFGGAKPERILRVLDGDEFVSVRAEGDWIGSGAGLGMEDVEEEDEPVVVGVGDLRRKLVSRRKERYHSCPASSSLSPQPQPLPLLPPPSPRSPSSSPLPLAPEQGCKSRKSSKSSKDQDRRKRKEGKAGGDKEERRRKRRKEKEGSPAERSRDIGGHHGDKERGRKSGKEEKGRGGRSSRSDSRKRKKKRHSSPEAARSRNSSRRGAHGRRSRSSLSEERHREKERDRDKERKRDRDRDRDKEREQERERDRDRDRDKDRERDRDRDRDRDRAGDRRRDDRDRYRDSNSSRRKSERDGQRHSSSRERGSSSRSKRSRERREQERERDMERQGERDMERQGERDMERQRDMERECERRRDGRPVVPPSIQDLNGSDLFAIKRTITVTTTTTTTTVPGSSPLDTGSSRSPVQDSNKTHKRKKRRRRRSVDEVEDGGSRQSRSLSLSPPRYHGYESDRYSDKLEIDMLSLDGEALDSDYPSLEDSPLAALPPQSPILSPKANADSKSGRHHPKKKSRTGKKTGQAESSSSSSLRAKSKGLSSLSPTQATSGSGPISSVLPSARRGRKVAKDKERVEKGGRKESSRSGKSKKESSGIRKGKLQSKVSVMVRDGVSSTTGASVGSGKLGMDLLGAGGPGGGNGGSIAVVFRRDNESRSPFLKPCSEPLSLGGRSKDLSKVGKRSSLAAPPSSSSLSSTAAPKSKRTKPSSTTSTSSSASSPSSSLATKRRRRLGKKTREKGGAGGSADGDDIQSKAGSEGWGGASSEIQSGVGGGTKSLSPHSGPAGPAPCSSSSSSSTGVLPPSSSPPHTPPPSTGPSRDARESSPDSQTVDSSCKTPEPSFLPEDCPTQTTPNMPPSSPPTLSNSQGAGLGVSMSAPNMKPLPPDDGPKSLASPPCSSSSSGSASASLSLPPSASDPSSSSSSSSVSSSSANKPPPPPPPPPAAAPLPWSLQTGVDCTAGGVLALTALLFKMEEASIASRAKAQEFIQATSQIPPPPSLPPPPGPSPTQFILHGSLPLVGCTKTPPSHLHPGMSMTPPPPFSMGFSGATGSSGDMGWDIESKDPDKYLKKLHTQERAVEEVKLAIKPYYQRKDINKDEYKSILRKAVHKICHSRTGEINPVKVSNLVKLYVQRYKYFRKHGRKMEDEEREDREQAAFYST